MPPVFTPERAVLIASVLAITGLFGNIPAIAVTPGDIPVGRWVVVSNNTVTSVIYAPAGPVITPAMRASAA